MSGSEMLDAFLREHGELRAKLRDCAAAQSQVADGSFAQCLHAVGVLQELCRLLEHEVAHHFQEEETALYAMLRQRLPQLGAAVGEFEREHEVIRQAFDAFRRELARFNTSGELGQLPHLGRELVAFLRHHMDREETVLHPVILREFVEDDWLELRRLSQHTRVA